jgi:hypothetical protein
LEGAQFLSQSYSKISNHHAGSLTEIGTQMNKAKADVEAEISQGAK